MRTTLLSLFLLAGLAAGVGGGCRSTGPGPARASAPVELDGIVLQDLRGQEHDLGRREAPVVLVFWQTWCGSCRAEAPAVVEAAAAHPELEFYGVVSGPDDVVDDDEVRFTAAQLRYAFPQLRDRDLTLTDRLHVQGTPTLVVVDPAGRELYRAHDVPENWTSILAGGPGPGPAGELLR